MKRLWILIALLLVTRYTLHVTPVLAQEEPKAVWSTYGIVINDAPGNTPQQNPKLISDGYGGYITVWEDGRAGYYDIYAQKIDELGRLLWKKDGVAACEYEGNQNFPQAAVDGAGGVIIVWQDYRNGNSDLYAQRISYGGEPLWGKGGVPVSTAEAGQFAPEIIADGYGGAIIVWHDYRSGSGEDVYAQRIDANGKPLWLADGAPVSAATGTQWYPKIVSNGSGGAIIAWTDGRTSSSDNNIYVQHLDLWGKALWEKDGIPVCSASNNQERPIILAVPKGAIIAWNDSRSGNVDIYAQKIDLAGNLLWDKDGVAASAVPYSQQNPKLAPDGSGGVVMVWADERAEQSDIYAQRIYSDGRIAWSENGRVVCKGLGKQQNPVITPLPNEDWLVLWEEDQSGKTKVDLYAQKINSAGLALWRTDGLPIAAAREMQESPTLVTTPKGNVILAWQDNRFGNYDLYAQKISPDGALLWDKAGIVVCSATGSVAQQNIEIAPNGRDEIILAFEDQRAGYFNIYLQKINKNGRLAWGANGKPVAKGAANQLNPRIVPDGAGGVFIAWEDYRVEEYPAIRLQRINSEGRNLWESSLVMAQIKSRKTRPLMVSDRAGGVIIAWQDDRDVLSLIDLYAQRISGKGELLWGKNGKAVISANGEQVEAAMISDGAGGAILAWTDYRRGDRNPDVYSQRLNAKGDPLWSADGVLVCGAPDVQRAPQVVSDGENGAIISWTDKGGGSYDIYAQRIDGRGRAIWMTDGIPINQLSRTQQEASFGNRKILAWEDYRYGNWDIFAQAVSPAGKLLWQEEGAPVVMVPHTQYAPQIASWKDGSVILAWEDYRSGIHYEIFIQRLSTEGKRVWTENGLKIKSFNGGRAPKILATPADNSFYIFWEDYTGGGKAIFGQRYLLY
ncbi:MAG: hypothetical protein PHH60_01055 [Candidatus Margulisbacteria bacterium]|nr:hypothetical protein [Candidatus Margulisiibacteriota bacterium]